MAEYIEREKAIEYLTLNMGWHDEDGYPVDDWDERKAHVADLINGIPAADVRPVVLCRDCKYCRRVDEFEYWCDGFCSPARLVRTDDFCSHGKRKERLT